MRPDNYCRPESLGQALECLDEGEYLRAGGCTDLFAQTQDSRLQGRILDITGIRTLRGIRESTDTWTIGAATTWSDIVNSDLPPAFDALKQAGREVGSIQIQNSGTIAGNICNASPAADGVPCLLCLDAEVVLQSKGRQRSLPIAEFILGPRHIALRENELMTAVRVPRASCRGISCFKKLGARTHLLISIAMAAVRVDLSPDGRIADIAVALGACSPVATRLFAVEEFLRGAAADRSLLSRLDPALVEGDIAPISDIRATGTYRGKAAYQLVLRTLESCLEVRGEARS